MCKNAIQNRSYLCHCNCKYRPPLTRDQTGGISFDCGSASPFARLLSAQDCRTRCRHDERRLDYRRRPHSCQMIYHESFHCSLPHQKYCFATTRIETLLNKHYLEDLISNVRQACFGRQNEYNCNGLISRISTRYAISR